MQNTPDIPKVQVRLRWPLQILITWLSLELIGLLVLLVVIGPLVSGQPATSISAWVIIGVGLLLSIGAAIQVGAKLTPRVSRWSTRAQLVLLVILGLVTVGLFPVPYYFGAP